MGFGKSKKNGDTMPKKGKRKVGLFILLGVVIFIVIVAAIDAQKDENTETPQTTTQSDGAGEGEAVDAPASTEEQIKSIAVNAFGDENPEINYADYNSFVLIKPKGAENLTNEMTVKGMFTDMSDTLRELAGIEEIKNFSVGFNVVYSMVDEYGNTSDDIVIKATFTPETRDKINWDNFLFEDIPSVADEWWMHPALENALAE
jgi:hypothetical protein